MARQTTRSLIGQHAKVFNHYVDAPVRLEVTEADQATLDTLSAELVDRANSDNDGLAYRWLFPYDDPQ